MFPKNVGFGMTTHGKVKIDAVIVYDQKRLMEGHMNIEI